MFLFIKNATGLISEHVVREFAYSRNWTLKLLEFKIDFGFNGNRITETTCIFIRQLGFLNESRYFPEAEISRLFAVEQTKIK